MAEPNKNPRKRRVIVTPDSGSSKARERASAQASPGDAASAKAVSKQAPTSPGKDGAVTDPDIVQSGEVGAELEAAKPVAAKSRAKKKAKARRSRRASGPTSPADNEKPGAGAASAARTKKKNNRGGQKNKTTAEAAALEAAASEAAAPEAAAPEAASGDMAEDGDDGGEVLEAELVSEDEYEEPEDFDDDDDSDIDDDALDRIASGSGAAGTSRSRSKKSDSSRIGLIKRDPLTAYVQETKRHALLSREEEHELAVKVVEDQDAAAARRLIEANLRLVVKIAYEYRRAHRNLLDLIQEGNIGLMQAVSKYDPYRGVKLSSYAAWWIRAYILKFVLNNWRLVKIGTTQAQRKLFFNLRKEKDRLEQLGFTPTPALLAENLEVAEKDVVEMEKRLSAPDASLDAPVGSDDEDGSRTRLDTLPSNDGARPDLQVAQSQFHELLRAKLEAFADTLEGREETIFRERWLTESPLTLQQIGNRYSISRERARQLEKRMLNRLRKYLEEEFGTAVDIDALSLE